jgi:hypothetical protein
MVISNISIWRVLMDPDFETKKPICVHIGFLSFYIMDVLNNMPELMPYMLLLDNRNTDLHI